MTPFTAIALSVAGTLILWGTLVPVPFQVCAQDAWGLFFTLRSLFPLLLICPILGLLNYRSYAFRVAHFVFIIIATAFLLACVIIESHAALHHNMPPPSGERNPYNSPLWLARYANATSAQCYIRPSACPVPCVPIQESRLYVPAAPLIHLLATYALFFFHIVWIVLYFNFIRLASSKVFEKRAAIMRPIATR